MTLFEKWLGEIKDLFQIPLFKLGDTFFTAWTFLHLLVFLALLFYLSARFRTWVADRFLARRGVEIGVRQAVGTISRYVLVIIGLVIILQTAGIDLTTLTVLAGAVGIGVGFGLQNIANNFISGLIILFERPIKIGDRIEVGTVEGDVIKIGARSTTVLTNDNIAIIVPNSKFITENVVNWSHTGRTIRFRIPVSVGYGSDVRLVEHLLLQVAKENPDVLDHPAPAVRLVEFGDSGLHVELRAWTTALLHRKGTLVSALNYAIIDTFREHRVEIPYPQRDLHIRSGWREADSTQASA
jgi:small-conductance mechanosensitive channel